MATHPKDYDNMYEKYPVSEEDGLDEQPPRSEEDLVTLKEDGTLSSGRDRGWICPSCETVWSPYISSCSCNSNSSKAVIT